MPLKKDTDSIINKQEKNIDEQDEIKENDAMLSKLQKATATLSSLHVIVANSSKSDIANHVSNDQLISQVFFFFDFIFNLKFICSTIYQF